MCAKKLIDIGKILTRIIPREGVGVLKNGKACRSCMLPEQHDDVWMIPLMGNDPGCQCRWICKIGFLAQDPNWLSQEVSVSAETLTSPFFSAFNNTRRD